jgi:AcrR family transcriptional regulator
LSQKIARNAADDAATANAAGDAGAESRFAVAKRRVVRKRAPGRPTLDQASELRESVLHAALRIFMARGYEAASIEGIAREARVAKITLYRQYRNKEQLFLEVARFAQADVTRTLEAAIDTDGPVEQVLRQMISGLHKGLTHPDYLAVLRLVIGESQRFPEIAYRMLHDSDYVLEPMIRYLRKLEREGRLVLDSPRDAALQVSCLAIGGARFLMVKPTYEPRAGEHWVDAVTALFMRAWQVKPEKPVRAKGRAKPRRAAAKRSTQELRLLHFQPVAGLGAEPTRSSPATPACLPP